MAEHFRVTSETDASHLTHQWGFHVLAITLNRTRRELAGGVEVALDITVRAQTRRSTRVQLLIDRACQGHPAGRPPKAVSSPIPYRVARVVRPAAITGEATNHTIALKNRDSMSQKRIVVAALHVGKKEVSYMPITISHRGARS